MKFTESMLCKDLTQAERMYLASFTHHDAFPVIKKLIADACKNATEEVMRVDPSAANYDAVLKATQQRARAINEFAEVLIRSFNEHVKNGVAEVEREAEKEEKRRSPN